MTHAEILSKAADILDAHGWCQGDHQHGGKRDIDAAIWSTNAPKEECFAAMDDLADFLGELSLLWNDVPGRTHEEAVKALRDCAAKVRENNNG
jgi:hypothetical protein